MKRYKVLIDSGNWYCQSNLVASSSLYRYLIKNHHVLTHDPSEADYIIINSCGVFKETEDKSINLYKKYSSEISKDAKIIMYGCLVKINRKRLDSLNISMIDFDENDKLDEIFYNTTKFCEITSFCNGRIHKKISGNRLIYNFEEKRIFRFPRMLFLLSKKFRNNYDWVMHHFGYDKKISVEIVERGTGCVGDCSYCVIKKAKTWIRSRPINEIIKDIQEANTNSAETLILVADDCGGYGVDTGSNLPELLHEINRHFPNLSIEINYLNPLWLTRQSNEYINAFKTVKIDFAMITTESGSNRIIRKMNRNYDVKKVMKVLKKIKKVAPNTFLATHFITGYPSESTIDFIKSLWISHYFDLPFPFPYQDREGAASSLLPNKKSNFTIFFRYSVFMLFCKLKIFHKLLTYRNYNF